MQHNYTTQDTEQDNTENKAQNTDTQHSTENSTDNLYTYSFDLYHEQIYIKNSDTIELYTILQENI